MRDTIIISALLTVVGFLMFIALWTPVRADHPIDGCELKTGPQTWSGSPSLTQGVGPWQLGQREINLAAEPRQFLTQVPWGEPSDIYIIPYHYTMVLTFCDQGVDVTVILVDAWWSYDHTILHAAHEFMHTWNYADHIRENLLYDPRYQWDTQVVCDGLAPDPYTGILSYCVYTYSTWYYENGRWIGSYPYRWQDDDRRILNDIWSW
jgi:hypothetical protein